MNNNIKYILLSTVLFLASLSLKGQTSTDTAALFKRIREIYTVNKAVPISYDFTIFYLQDGDKQEDNVKDTMFSHIELDGIRMHTKSKEVEVMQNEKYIISVIPDQQQMMVGKTPVKPQMPAYEALNNELLSKVVTNWEERTADKKKTLMVRCNPEMGITSFEFSTDVKTGRLEEIKVKFPKALLPNQETENTGPSRTHTVIKYIFSNYQPISPSFPGFNERNYFDIVEKEYVPAAAFKGYQIFLASPNL
ncbi:MAG: hypothetical protein JO154_26500 [Chitinophaga sp.]|uniref:hypothetical protein n=1 Tax=Chitinophaga sp. TaxID=1869181 RepID=UPI0025C3AD0C|nr:hypothetical protein [Chitinophaga sp.]MBV8256173.1 hypothetical protein [Chitinophaga sp.]